MIWEVGGEIHQLSAFIETPDRNSKTRESQNISSPHTHTFL